MGYCWRGGSSSHPLESAGLMSGLEGGWRREHHRKHRKSRSWHPSPYVSDEDDDQLSREEKKHKIKVEIARRRQQIEENARLHEELLRLARLRESAELGFMPAPLTEWYGGYPSSTYPSSISPSTQEGTSVLKSIDEILRDEAGKRSVSLDYGRMSDYGNSYYSLQGGMGGSLHFDYNSYQPQSHSSLYKHHSVSRISGLGGTNRGGPNNSGGFGLTEEDRSIDRIASTFRTDDYTTSVYERLSDFSPLATDSESLADFTPAAMPLLPDMPTRSRKLLEDLGSSPITESVLSLPQKGQARYKTGNSGGSGGGGVGVGGGSNMSSSGGGGGGGGMISSVGGEPRCNPYPDNYGTLGGSSRKPLKTGGFTSSSSSSPAATLGGGGSGGGGGGGGSGGGSGGGGFTGSGEGSKQPKKSQPSHIQHTETEYDFPVKRLFLTRDPEDRSVGGNGLGMRIVGGREIPGSEGQLGAFVTRIYPGGVVDTFGDVAENDQILEWNGVNLTNKTFEEVQNLISEYKGDIELVIKSHATIPPSNSVKSSPAKILSSRSPPGGTSPPPLLISPVPDVVVRRRSTITHQQPSCDLTLISSEPHSNSSSYDNLSSTSIDM